MLTSKYIKKYFYFTFILAILIYFYLCNFNIHRIPLNFYSFHNKPLMKAEIEGVKYSLLVDTGSSNDLGIHEKKINKIFKKQFLDTKSLMDLKGDVYSVKRFLVPSASIGNLSIKKVTIQEETSSFFENAGLLWTDSLNPVSHNKKYECIDGSIGRSIFFDWVSFFNFRDQVIFLTTNINEMKKNCNINQFISVPLIINKYGINITLETDFGMKRFILDTGANLSVLQESQITKENAKEIFPGRWQCITNQLKTESHDFGNWPFWLYEFCPEAEFDGILGVDFFKKHLIIFDFQNQTAYICDKPFKDIASYSFRIREFISKLINHAI